MENPISMQGLLLTGKKTSGDETAEKLENFGKRTETHTRTYKGLQRWVAKGRERRIYGK